MKQSRLFLTFCSFAVTLSAYLLYNYVLVPIILPANPPPAPLDGTSEERIDKELLAMIFDEKSWVMKKYNHLAFNEQGKLLFGNGDYEKTEAGELKLSPVAIIFFPKEEGLSEKERYRRAIVMEAPQAFIEFDGSLVGGASPIPKKGRLEGNIEIRSKMKSTGPEDDLLIRTQNLFFDQKMVRTNQPVDFQLGPNHGKSRGMSIELTRRDSLPGSADQMPDSIKRVEMVPPVELTFFLENESKDSTKPATEPTTAILLCKEGPTEIVPSPVVEGDWTIRFKESVDLHRVNPQGASDQMNCSQLELTFGPKKAGIASSSNSGLGALSSSTMVVSLIDAIGHPVHVISPENKNLDMRSERLTIDPIKNEISLTRGNTVSVTYDSLTLTGKAIYYSLGENDEIGKLDIPGQGMLQGTVGEGVVRPLKIEWSEQLLIAPDKDKDNLTCVHVRGNLNMNMQGIGGLTADEAFIWCEQGKQTPTKETSQNPIGKSVSLTPKYALIKNNVQIKTDQGDCYVNELEIWFVNGTVANISTPIQQVAMRPIPQQGEGSGQLRTSTAVGKTTILQGGFFGQGKSNANSRYTVRAEKMRINAILLGKETIVDQVILMKNVSLDEKQITPNGEEPIHVEGQNVHIRQPGTPKMSVEILGDKKIYAMFEGRGAKLMGSNININQATNTFWINGQGRLQLSGIDSNKAGNLFGNILTDSSNSTPTAKRNEEVIVEWLGQMQFDGSVINFEEDVNVAYTLGSIQHCQKLQIYLTQPFRFFESQTVQPGINRVVIVGEVEIDRDSYDKNNPQKMVSRDHIKFNSVEINPQTGDFKAFGPGYVSSITVTGDMSQKLGAMASTPVTTPTVTQENTDSLSYIYVEFYESITGNYTKKQLHFNNRVRCILYPVKSFSEKINVNDTRLVVASGALLTCDDQLTVFDTSLPNSSQTTYTLTADGNAALETTVNGTIYEGHGDRMSYDQARDLLTLEGGRYTSAVLNKKATPNSMTEELFKLKKIEMNLKTEAIRTQ